MDIRQRFWPIWPFLMPDIQSEGRERHILWISGIG
jgi:hypothetical protein